MDRRRIIDQWSPVSHRAGLANGGDGGSQAAPTWVGTHGRRLAAYRVFSSYLRNVARDTLALDDPKIVADLEKLREYGDPKTFRDAIVSALFGYDPPQIVVAGAEDDVPEDAEDGEHRRAAQAAAAARQDELREWDRREMAGRKMFLGEQHAVGLGDAVWVYRISHEKRRVTVDVYEPGFYFPVITQADDGFPRKIHLAWEYEDRQADGTVIDRVRRQTWELVRLVEADEGVREEGNYPDGSPRFVRDYRWNVDPAGAVVGSPWTCRYSDATWDLAAFKDVERDFVGQASWATNEEGVPIRDLDLAIDFIPLVHQPNTPVSEHEHYGESSLANVAQIHDDIARTDTDIAAAAATTGIPILGASGVGTGKQIEVRPGTVINLGQDGKLTAIEMADGLRALMELQGSMLDRRDANGRVPSALIGRVDPSKIQAGIILSLSFGPLRSLIGEMRMTRDESYPLGLKIVQRMSIAAGFYADATVYDASWSTSSYLPTDDAALIEQIRKLLGDGQQPSLVSRATALKWLMDAGFDYTDASDELARIESEDFAGAERLLSALGDGPWVDEYLGRDPKLREQHEQQNPPDPGVDPATGLPLEPPAGRNPSEPDPAEGEI